MDTVQVDYTFLVVEVYLEHLVALVDQVACKKVADQGMMAELVAYHRIASEDTAVVDQVDFDNFVVDRNCIVVVVVVVVMVMVAFHAFEVVRKIAVDFQALVADFEIADQELEAFHALVVVALGIVDLALEAFHALVVVVVHVLGAYQA